MARIAGVDIPREKRLEISLTLHLRDRSHHGAARSATRPSISRDTRVRDLTEDEVARLRAFDRREPQGRG